MHRQQAQIVHQGVQYDLEVDSAASTPAALAQLVVARLNHP
nr:hypothetical protein [Deinococcus cavernae]